MEVHIMRSVAHITRKVAGQVSMDNARSLAGITAVRLRLYALWYMDAQSVSVLTHIVHNHYIN